MDAGSEAKLIFSDKFPIMSNASAVHQLLDLSVRDDCLVSNGCRRIYARHSILSTTAPLLVNCSCNRFNYNRGVKPGAVVIRAILEVKTRWSRRAFALATAQ